jgi:predicted  nucleic acid-binding Zn-ribbon protein
VDSSVSLPILLAVIGALATIIAAAFAYRSVVRSSRAQQKSAELATVLGGYDKLITALQSEVHRLSEAQAAILKELEACDKRNADLEKLVQTLRNQIAEAIEGRK